MRKEIPINEHMAVGPTNELHSHSPVLMLTEWKEEEGREYADNVYVCTNCGLTSDDSRDFYHEECNREDNRMNQTWEEKHQG